MTDLGDLPVEVRRLNFGWFGDPWPSGVCYDDGGRLREEMRKPVPVGELCLWCGEPIEAGHFGQAMPHIGAGGRPAVGHVHGECQLRSVAGSPGHLDGRCTCRGPGARDLGLSYRDEALAVWARLVGSADEPAAARFGGD